MKSSIKKAFIIWAVVMAFILSPSLMSQERAQERAVIKSVPGKVTILKPGGTWQTASADTVISAGTTVSTGFNSTALLDLGSSEISVKPLTRMKLSDLIKQEGTVKTSLELTVGRVRATVKPAEGLTHDFTLRSSVSTASVRGTDFEYDGETLTVFDGDVLFFNAFNQKRMISRGETSTTTGYSTPTTGEETQIVDSSATLYTNEVVEFEGGASSEPVVETVDMVNVTIGVE